MHHKLINQAERNTAWIIDVTIHKNNTASVIILDTGCLTFTLFQCKNERRTENMINNEITTTKGMESAQKALEQAKNRYAQEKKKAN